jgi:uncharacterized protein YndB with AHSA1/START domain
MPQLQMIDPLVKVIEVPCGQQQAFTVFLEMSSWWPTNRFATSVMRGQTVKTIRVDAQRGGRIVEVSSDGQEHVWGTINIFEPYAYLSMDFHVPHPSERTPGFSTVEVRFTPLAGGRTRVELTQSNWEGLGDSADMSQKGYRQAWGLIFDDAYGAACAREASHGTHQP